MQGDYKDNKNSSATPTPIQFSWFNVIVFAECNVISNNQNQGSALIVGSVYTTYYGFMTDTVKI